MKSQVLIPLVIGGLVFVGTQPSRAQQADAKLPFSVRDSIEMITFSDPYTRTEGTLAKESPDENGFVIVTTQGQLATNTIESSVWYYSAAAVESYLDNAGEHVPPRPRRLFHIRGVPMAPQSGPYGSLITDVQWTDDSKNLMCLVEQKEGSHHAYKLSVNSGKAIDLSQGEIGDVATPQTLRGTTLYLESARSNRRRRQATPLVLTGGSIYDIMFPKEFPDPANVGTAWKLKVRYRGKTETYPSEGGRYFPLGAAQVFHPVISPNGAQVLSVAPVMDVPSQWQIYRSANETKHFTPSTQSSDRSGRAPTWPWQYVLIDLVTGKTMPLSSSPVAFNMGYGSPFAAAWSQDGNRVLITNTYLPLSSEDPESESSRPCAIAEYLLRNKAIACLPSMPFRSQGEHIVSVSYNAQDQVIATIALQGHRSARTYDRGLGQWKLHDEPEARLRDLRLFIKQDIGEPPTLWTTNGPAQKLLWDPNPQLKSLKRGKASVYQWTDSSGYTWHGGLIVPDEPRPKGGFPLVVQTHGFYNPHEFLVDGAYTSGYAAAALAANGIAVLQMEDRLDRHSRPAAVEADDEIFGIETAIDRLVEAAIVDKSHVGVQGFSRTQWYVTKALEHDPSRYKAALMVDGVDMSYLMEVLFAQGNSAVGSETEAANGGTPFGTGLAKWFQHAAGFNLDKINTPVRLEAIGSSISILGEWETYSILQQQGKPVDLIDIPDGQHILQKPSNRYTSQQGAVDWFRFWLQGYKRPDAEDKSQYQRWTAMQTTSKMH